MSNFLDGFIYGLFGALLIGAWTSAATATVIPDLRGQQLEEAVDIAETQQVELEVERRDAVARPGTIFEQDPGPGAPMSEDRRMVVFVSQGVVVPDLHGVSLDEGREQLARIGLESEVASRADFSVEAGHVADLIPPAGTRVDPTTSIVFVVVSDLRVASIPDGVIGSSPSDAEASLVNRGFKVTFDPFPANPVQAQETVGSFEEGTSICESNRFYRYRVERIEPDQGAVIPHGSAVRIYLSRTLVRVEQGVCRLERGPQGGPQP